MRKYIDNFLIYGSAIVGFAAFFKIDAQSVSSEVSAMSARTIVLILSGLAFVTGLILKWMEKNVTTRNVEGKIRKWLDNFKILHGVYDYEPWHFTLAVTFFNQRMFIGRPRTQSGRYIVIQLRTTGVMPEHRKAFDAMSKSEKSEFYGQLALETARARISFTANDQLSDISINKSLPITSKLTESDIIDGLSQVYQSGVVIWNTIALRLSESPVLKQLSPATDSTLPLPIPDTEEPGQSQV